MVPAKAREALHRTADHLTFSKDFAPLLADPSLTRAGIIEALQWALGAVMTKAMFFPKPGAEWPVAPEAKAEAHGHCEEPGRRSNLHAGGVLRLRRLHSQ